MSEFKWRQGAKTFTTPENIYTANIQPQRLEGNWVSVLKVMPATPPDRWSEPVLVYTDAGNQLIDSFFNAASGEGFWQHCRAPYTCRPLFWMPLPVSPQA